MAGETGKKIASEINDIAAKVKMNLYMKFIAL